VRNVLALVSGLMLLAGSACERAPSSEEVRAMEQALDAIPYDAGDGTIREDRFQLFLGVRRAVRMIEIEGRAKVEELRRANEGSNVPSTAQINRVRRHTNRMLAVRAKALADAKMNRKEYNDIMNALADIPWEPEMFRPDGLTPVQLANARLFQAQALPIRETTDVDALRALRAKAR
jgi:hypothetical protein